jgi:hypothetical protein
MFDHVFVIFFKFKTYTSIEIDSKYSTCEIWGFHDNYDINDILYYDVEWTCI